jgi:hypothetical protein
MLPDFLLERFFGPEVLALAGRYAYRVFALARFPICIVP